MPRVKRGKSHLKKRKRLLKAAKGYRGGRKSKIRLAKTAVTKAGVYAYRDRRRKKREARALWQIKINAACRENGITYSQFIHKLKNNKIELDRKILANLAENYSQTFSEIVKSVQK
ncbi:50S ribosomal protein L20 [Patescibacteria group bacterium AH-259-L07]|nr:50S ribosomal protein L20 [Patescibacteria group bacterium AH-259-L07]